MIGRDGMVGLPLLLGAESDDVEAMVQQPGTALRMEAAALRAALEQHPDFRALLLRYVLVHHGQVVRTAACNLRHQLEQRLARWMLMAHDRVENDSFAMTHEFLVTVVCTPLRRWRDDGAGQAGRVGWARQ